MPHTMNRYTQAAERYMRRPVRTVSHDTDLPSVFAMLNRFRISGVAVSEESERGSPVIGVVTRTDLLSLADPPHAGDHRTAADVMTRDVIAVDAKTPIGDVARTMVDEHIHRVFIVDGSTLVGVVTPHELIRAIVDMRHPTPISEYVVS